MIEWGENITVVKTDFPLSTAGQFLALFFMPS